MVESDSVVKDVGHPTDAAYLYDVRVAIESLVVECFIKARHRRARR